MKVIIELYDGNIKLKSHSEENFVNLEIGCVSMLVKISDLQEALRKMTAK